VTPGTHPDLGSCDIATDCLKCPLPFCRHDDPQLAAKLRKPRKPAIWKRVHELSGKGMSYAKIARATGYSKTQVGRILREQMKEPKRHYDETSGRALLRRLSASTWAKPYHPPRLLAPGGRT